MSISMRNQAPCAGAGRRHKTPEHPGSTQISAIGERFVGRMRGVYLALTSSERASTPHVEEFEVTRTQCDLQSDHRGGGRCSRSEARPS